jgi:hypothetical protein
MADFLNQAADSFHSVQFWLGVVIGGAIGAVLSVTADRLYQRFERRIKVQISPAAKSEANGQNGLLLKIKNVGAKPIPSFRPWLVNTDCKYTMFNTATGGTSGELGPKQHEEFFGAFFINNQLQKIPEHILNAAKSADFTFQLVMDKSDVVLYQNKRMGKAIVRALHKSNQTPSNPDPTRFATRVHWDMFDGMDMTTVHGVRRRAKRVWNRLWLPIRYGREPK